MKIKTYIPVDILKDWPLSMPSRSILFLIMPETTCSHDVGSRFSDKLIRLKTA